MDRREFLKWSVKAGTAFSLTFALPRSAGRLWAVPIAEYADIAVVRGDVEKSVKAAVDLLGGIGRFVRKGQRVLIKPNMSFPNPPEWGTTTDPFVTAKVAELCREAGAGQILIADNPLRRPDICLKRSGILDAVQNIPRTYTFAAKDRTLFEQVEVPGGKVLKAVEVLKELLKADVLINLPVAKSHNAAGVSLGMKNLMGLIWDREAFHEKFDLNEGIVDLSTLIRPNLIIVDATRALITSGPSGPGKVLPLGTIVAGTDPVAVDSYVVSLAKWYGRSFTGRNVRHLLLANQQGLGEVDITRLNIKEIAV
ncbi:MAG: DUF362 domain-containing protein [Spirochaetota bacterium]